MTVIGLYAPGIEVETTGGRSKATLSVAVFRHGRLHLKVEGHHGCDRDTEQEIDCDITVVDLERLLEAGRKVAAEGSVAYDGTVYRLGVDLVGERCDWCGDPASGEDPLVECDGDLVHQSCAEDDL